MERKSVPAELFLVTGLVLNSLAVSLTAYSALGTSTISSVPLAMFEIFPELGLGTWNFAAQSATMLVLVIVTRRFRSEYLISFLMGWVFGRMVDAASFLVAMLPINLPLRILYYLTGFLFIAAGASLLLKCGLPVLPFDTFVRDLTRHLNATVKKVKTGFDFTCIAISVVLSVLAGRLISIGVGTVFSACFTGAVMQYVCTRLDERYCLYSILHRTPARGRAEAGAADGDG